MTELELLRELRVDLERARGKLDELERQLAARDLAPPPVHVCETCSGLIFRSALGLAEHRYYTHGGPEPELWLRQLEQLDEDAAV